MASKSSFTPEEWSRLVASPVVASMAITAADPGGLWSLLQESMSSGWALLEAKQDAQATPLVKAVADDITNTETRNAVREIVPGAVQGQPVRRHQDARPSRSFTPCPPDACLGPAKGARGCGRLQSLAVERRPGNRRKAGKEGGFLGFGGVAVGESTEKASPRQEIRHGRSGSPAGARERRGLAET